MAKKFFMFVLCISLACSLVFSAAGYDRETRARLILTPSEYIDRLRGCYEVAPITEVGDMIGDFDFSDETIALKAEKHMIAKEKMELYDYTETDPTTPGTSESSGGVVLMSLVTLSNGEILDLSTAVGRCTYLSTMDKTTLKVPNFWTTEMNNSQPETALGAIWEGIKNIGNFFVNLVRFLWNLKVTFVLFFATLYNAAVYLVFRCGYVLCEVFMKLAVKFNEWSRKRVNWSYLGASLIPINWELLYKENKIGTGSGKVKIPFVRNSDKYVEDVCGHRGGR